ncbi:hypothetical protein GCM10022247_54670 [Allokutzneria multivorans]|uniref:Uncharacterized protein n=2 Tax=Allokutzneria multivorans TaxID=1142134 RepID=A0ABP7TAZ2_9PSEU
MSSCRELALRLRQIAARLPVRLLHSAAVNAHEAASGLLAAQGERDTQLRASAAALQQAALTAAGSAEGLVWAVEWIESYCTTVLGVAADAPAPVPVLAVDVYAAAAVPRLSGSKPPSASEAYSTTFKLQPALATPARYEARLQRSDATTFGMPPDRRRGAEIVRLDDERDRLERDSDGLITHVMGEHVEDYARRVSQERAVVASNPQKHWKDTNPGAKPPKELYRVGKEQVCAAIAIDLRTGLVAQGVNGRSQDVVPEGRLHPLLQQNLQDLRAYQHRVLADGDGTLAATRLGSGLYEGQAHYSQPAAHAEVKAVNELLWERQDVLKAGARLPASVLAELRFDARWTAPQRQAGTGDPAPACANCSAILRGVPTYSGRCTYDPCDYRYRNPAVEPHTDKP